MAKKNSAVLWTVEQTLGDNDATKKTNKERARHNVGINFEPTAGENHDQPPTPSGNTLSFVDKIDEAADGTLTYTRKDVTVDESIDSTSDHPVRNSAIATALNNLKTFYATQSTTFAQLKTAYDAGQTLVFINDGLAYQLNWVNKLNNAPITFEFSNLYMSASQEDKGEGKVYDTFLRIGAWSCTSSSGWSQAITPKNVVCQDYADYRVGALQSSDVAIATGDKLVISDSSDHGKGVRSEIAFDTTASETSFLNQRGAWNTALPTYTESTDPLASNYWDNLSGTKFYTIKSSPTPASNNTSPEEGNMFALTGEFDRGSGNKYKVQLAMGDTLYYRHTTGTAGTTWSEWKQQFEAYRTTTTSATTRTLFGFHLYGHNGASWPFYVKEQGTSQYSDTNLSLVARPTATVQVGQVLTAKKDTTDNTYYFDWMDNDPYTAGVDLKIVNKVISVDTTSTIGQFGDNSFVLGTNCSIDNDSDSFVFGLNNSSDESEENAIGGAGNRVNNHDVSFVFGRGNSLGPNVAESYTTYGQGNVILGDNNSINMGSQNLLFGHSNRIQVGNSTTDLPARNILIGYNNSIGSNSLAEYAHDTILIGNQLRWADPDYTPLVLGVYNSNDWRYKSVGLIPLRITGGGTIDSGGQVDEKNVEVMYSDGLIWSNSGFEVSDDAFNQTYISRIYKTLDDQNIQVIGTGMYSKWTETDVMSQSQTINHAETGHLSNTFVSITASKSDTTAVTKENPTGTVYLNAISNMLLTRALHDQHDPGDKAYAPVVEFSSSAAGGNVGLTMGPSALPAWNRKDAQSLGTDISVTWLRLYGNRISAKDIDGDVLPSDNRVPPGNLEVGRLAVKFYKESELTSSNPLIPGQKVGDIAFIVGDPSISTHGFYIYDRGDYDSSHAYHHETAYITTGFQFCMLMTIEPSVFTGGLIATPGVFSCLHC